MENTNEFNEELNEEFLLKSKEKLKDSRISKIAESVNPESVRGFDVDPEYAPYVCTALKEKGFKIAVLKIDGSGIDVGIVDPYQIDKVNDLIDDTRKKIIETERLDPANLKDECVKSSIVYVKGLDKFQAAELEKEMRLSGIKYALTKDEQTGTHAFAYSDNDRKIAQKYLKLSLYHLTGENGKYRKEIINLENSINEKIKKLEEKNEKFWLINRDTPSLRLHKDEKCAELYKDNERIDKAYVESKTFEAEYAVLKRKITAPIIFNENEIEKNISLEELRKKIEDKDKIKQRELYIQAEEQKWREEIHKIEEKLSIENVDLEEVWDSLYNSEQSVQTYRRDNELNKENIEEDIEEREINDKYQSFITKQKEMLSEVKAIMSTLTIETGAYIAEKSLDGIINDMTKGHTEETIKDKRTKEEYTLPTLD